jgi:hypothetical protein
LLADVRWHTDGGGRGAQYCLMTTTPDTPFTAIYAKWLDSFRVLIPGCAAAGATEEVRRRQEQVAANQEWEHEGGSLKP